GVTVTDATGGGAITTTCAVPLFASLVAVSTEDPGFNARIRAHWLLEDWIRATLESLMVHVTARPLSSLPWASRNVAKNRVLSPTTTVSVDSTLFFRSEEHTSELQSRGHLVCRLLLEKKNLRSTLPRRPAKAGSR